MNEHDDSQLEAALTATFADRDRRVGHAAGDIHDVYRRASRRRRQRRTLTAVAGIAIVAAGVGGLVALGQIDGDGVARSSGDSPTPSIPDDGGAWYVCSGTVDRPDGSAAFDWCELETPYANPAWQCTDPIDDPPLDADDRPRFERCTAVGEAYPTPVCVPVTLPTPSFDPTHPTGPPGTWVEQACVTSGEFAPPTTVIGTLPPEPTHVPTSSVPLLPVPTTYVHVCAPAPTLPDTPCATVPPDAPTTTTAAGQAHLVVAGDSLASIAEQYGVTLDELVAYNGWTKDHVLIPGATVPIPPSVLPVESPRVIGIGDSVMLGAADVLVPRGWTIVSQASLQMADAVPMVQQMAATGVFADTETVVIHLGTNGAFSAEQLDALLAPFADVPNVLLYTVHADRAWAEPNNALLRAVDEPGDNIAMIDWDTRAPECGDCLAADGIHLNDAGKRFYADLARDWTGS